MKQREILILSVGVFMTIIAWVVIELYKVRNSQIVEEQIVLPKVQEYEVDVSVIEKLREKQP
jgi:hypothetical protein